MCVSQEAPGVRGGGGRGNSMGLGRGEGVRGWVGERRNYSHAGKRERGREIEKERKRGAVTTLQAGVSHSQRKHSSHMDLSSTDW